MKAKEITFSKDVHDKHLKRVGGEQKKKTT